MTLRWGTWTLTFCGPGMGSLSAKNSECVYGACQPGGRDVEFWDQLILVVVQYFVF